MPKPPLFLALPLLALLLSFTRPAQAQYVVGGPNINLGTAIAGTPWTATINIGGSCNGQYANAYNGGNPPIGINPSGTQVGTVITFSGTPNTSGTYTWNADLFVPGYHMLDRPDGMGREAQAHPHAERVRQDRRDLQVGQEAPLRLVVGVAHIVADLHALARDEAPSRHDIPARLRPRRRGF